MYESPVSLQEVCMEYICENLSAFCTVQTNLDDGNSCLIFRGQDVFFHNNISDHMLKTICEKNSLSDDTMMLFDAKSTSLKHVKIHDAPVSTKGLRVLKMHKIRELEAIGLKEVTVNDLIGCLGEWTLNNLWSLNVMNGSFMNASNFCVVVSLSKLHSLKHLNVSNTVFNKHGLDIVTQDLPLLESLDISCTLINDLSPLKKCKARLKSLSVYGLRAAFQSDDIVDVLCDLTQLRHLDISEEPPQPPLLNLQPVRFKVDDFLQKVHRLPHLTSLDLSAREGIKEKQLVSLLDTHPKLTFLGLSFTDANAYHTVIEVEDDPNLSHVMVSGSATERQILESLRRYRTRPIFVQKALYHLFEMTTGNLDTRVDIVKLILPVMSYHPRDLSVQMAATACLYNLSKGEMGLKMHPVWLSEIVKLTMDAMQNFPNHQQLQKNALLTLCSDRILQDVNFDRYRCARLVMECLCTFDNQSMNRMSVAICSILAAKIPTKQTSVLGSKASYMKKLLAIVKQKMFSKVVDITMKFTLSALWNLTDESPTTCQTFLDEHGLELFMVALRDFSEVGVDVRVQVETKILGLMNNLAEVKQLRRYLMEDDVISMVHTLLASEHIDVSYFAAGIVSHLISDGEAAWTVESVSRAEMRRTLQESVLRWADPDCEMVAYRSFNPFFTLLTTFDAPEVQLWAVWAMHHVCSRNGPRYCPMLVAEGGHTMLQSLLYSDSVHQKVRDLVEDVLHMVNEQCKA